MMINRFLPITIAIILSVSAVRAQEEAEKITAPLTFREAIKIALDNNVAIKQQQNNLRSATTSRTAGLLQLGPSVEIQGNLGRNDGNSFNQQEGRVVNGVVDFTNVGLRTSMPLFQGLSRVNDLRAAKSGMDAQIEMVERTRQDVMQLVTSQYLQCLLDRELVKIAEGNLETQQQQLELVNAQVESGSRAEADVSSQQFQLKSAELALLRAKNALRNDKTILAQTLQMDPQLNFTLAEPDWEINKFENYDTVESLYGIALANRSDLESIKYSAAASKYNYRSAKGGYFPSVFAFFNYGSAYNYIHGSENRSFDQQFTSDNIQKTYGLSFTIPIFNGFATRASVVQSRVNYENRELEAANMINTVKSEVIRARQNLNDAVVAYSTAEVQLESATMANDLGSQRYELGISNLAEYTLTTQNYTQAQVDYASARYTLMFQELLLNYALGTLTYEDID